MKSEHGMRPIHFMLALWGKRYRDYFVDLCLPSLLSPNNLPLLSAEDGHRFIIATTSEDWHAIRGLKIMDRLRRHARPVWVDIGDSNEELPADAKALEAYSAVLRNMETCLRLMLDAGFDRNAYGTVLAPDVLLSDGFVAALLRYAQAGHHLVLRPALRQKEEAVLADLARLGLLGRDSRLSMTAQELTIPPRLAADLSVRHLHPEMFRFEEDAPDQPDMPPFRYWRVAEGRGIILHTFFAVPILMDYRVVPQNHTECLTRGAFENVYISENFAGCGGVHYVQDSDEFSILSLTPEAVNWSPQSSGGRSRRPGAQREQERAHCIRRSIDAYAKGGGDPVRGGLFDTAIRWHGGELDDVWREEERRIDAVIARAKETVLPAPKKGPGGMPAEHVQETGVVGTRLMKAARRTRDICKVIGQAARGDTAAKEIILKRIRARYQSILGTKAQPPNPDT